MLWLVFALVAAPPSFQPLQGKNDTPGVQASFDVEAPADLVLDLLWDVARFKHIFPDIKSLEVQARRPHEVDVKFDVDAVVAQPTYTLRRTLDEAGGIIRWVSIAGDLKHLEGRWIVRADGPTRSVVTYESFVDVGVPGISTVYRDIVLGKLSQMVDRVRAAAARARRPPPPSAETATAPDRDRPSGSDVDAPLSARPAPAATTP